MKFYDFISIYFVREANMFQERSERVFWNKKRAVKARFGLSFLIKAANFDSFREMER